MALTYLDAVNAALSAVGAVQTSSLATGGVAVQRVKGYVNEAFEEFIGEFSWAWNRGSKTLNATSVADEFSVVGLSRIISLKVTGDGGYTTTLFPNNEDLYEAYTPSVFTEESLWTSGVVKSIGAVVGYASNIYTATSTGTTGVTPPTHTTGIVTDGGVSWQFTRTFILPGLPIIISTPTSTLLRMRPYYGPLGLNRCRAYGLLDVARLSTDADTYPNLPVEAEGAVKELVAAITALKHLDDPQTAANLRKSYSQKLLALKRKARAGMTLGLTNNGVRL